MNSITSKIPGLTVFPVKATLAQTRLPSGGQAWHARAEFNSSRLELLKRH